MGSLSALPVVLLVVVSCCVIVVHPAPWRNYQVRQSQVCGDKLADMLSLICSGRGYNFAFKPEGANARRFRRGIVEECCRKSCTPALLELYCRADPTEPPSNVQIRKRSDSGESLEHQSTEVTSSPTSPKPEATDTNSLDRKTTNGDSTTTTAMKESESSYKILNLLASSEHSTLRHSSKGSATKTTPNDTNEEDLFPNSHFPPLRHHKNHHHNRRKFHSRKTSTKTKRDKNFHGGSTKTFEIGTVKPYFAGRAFASYRSSNAFS